MPKTRQETPDDTRWGRCKNCKRRFTKSRDDKLYCSGRCKNQYNNYGRTPQSQMEARLKSFMRTEAFRELMREALRKEVAIQALAERGFGKQALSSESKPS